MEKSEIEQAFHRMSGEILRIAVDVEYKEDELKITDDLVKKIIEKRIICINGIIKLHIGLSNPSREKNNAW